MAKCEIPRFDENIWTIFPFPSVEFWLIHRLKILKKKPMPPKLSQNLAQCIINWRISEFFLVQSRMWTISYDYNDEIWLKRFFVYSPKLYTLENFILLYFVLFFLLVCLFLYKKKITLLFLLKVKPSPDRKIIKLLFDQLITCFRHCNLSCSHDTVPHHTLELPDTFVPWQKILPCWVSGDNDVCVSKNVFNNPFHYRPIKLVLSCPQTGNC